MYRPPRPPGLRQVLDGWSEDTVNISTISSGHWGGGPQGMYRPPRPPGLRQVLDGWSEDTVNISTISSSHFGCFIVKWVIKECCEIFQSIITFSTNVLSLNRFHFSQ